MPYDDEKLREDEERFQNLLSDARKFARETGPEVARRIAEMIPTLELLTQIPERNEAEEEIFQRIKQNIEQFATMLRDTQMIIGVKLARDCRIYFEHIKKLAAGGDAKAKEIYEDLKQYLPDEDVNLN